VSGSEAGPLRARANTNACDHKSMLARVDLATATPPSIIRAFVHKRPVLLLLLIRLRCLTCLLAIILTSNLRQCALPGDTERRYDELCVHSGD